MLSLSRRVGQVVNIGADIEVMVTAIREDKVRLAIRAPAEIAISRPDCKKRPPQPASVTAATSARLVAEYRDGDELRAVSLRAVGALDRLSTAVLNGDADALEESRQMLAEVVAKAPPERIGMLLVCLSEIAAQDARPWHERE